MNFTETETIIPTWVINSGMSYRWSISEWWGTPGQYSTCSGPGSGSLNSKFNLQSICSRQNRQWGSGSVPGRVCWAVQVGACWAWAGSSQVAWARCQLGYLSIYNNRYIQQSNFKWQLNKVLPIMSSQYHC